MGVADDWVVKVSRLPEESVDLQEGFARSRALSYEVIVKHAHMYKELSAFLTHSMLPAYLSPYYTYDGSWWDWLCVLRTARVSRSMTDKRTLRIDYAYSTTQLPGGMGHIDPALFPRPPKPSGGGQGSGLEGGGSITDLSQLMPVVTIDYETYEEATRKSVVGTRIVMTNNKYPDSLPTTKKPIMVIKVKRMEKKFDPVTWRQFAFKLNDLAWNDYAPHQVLCFPWTVDSRSEIGGRWWYPTNYVFKCHPVDWLFHLVSMDVDQLKVGSTTVREPIPDPQTKQPIVYPWPLDANGRAIADPTAADPAVTVYQIEGTEDFGPLNVNNLFPETPP